MSNAEQLAKVLTPNWANASEYSQQVLYMYARQMIMQKKNLVCNDNCFQRWPKHTHFCRQVEKALKKYG